MALRRENKNLLDRNFTAAKPNRVWVGDVTYIWLKDGWAHLALLKDLFCHTVVRWAVSTSCDETLTRRALENAIQRRKPGPGLIHHTDRGATYTASDYRKRQHELGIRQSMSRRGDRWDNAPVESLHGTVKREAFAEDVLLDANYVRSIIFDYIREDLVSVYGT